MGKTKRMEGKRDEKKTTGVDTDAEEGVFGLAVCSGKCRRPARMHRQRREKKGERMREDERKSSRQKCRLSTDRLCTFHQ